jgi:hypothetical protein
MLNEFIVYMASCVCRTHGSILLRSVHHGHYELLSVGRSVPTGLVNDTIDTSRGNEQRAEHFFRNEQRAEHFFRRSDYGCQYKPQVREASFMQLYFSEPLSHVRQVRP